MNGPAPRAVLTAVASQLPAGRLSNADLERRFADCRAEKIGADTGILVRCIADTDEFTSDLAVRAAERLFALDERHREGIDFLILVTSSPDYLMPCTATLVQHALGLPQSLGAFDINLGCSGYPYALGQAAALIESGRARKILVITADKISAYTETAERNIQAIFGDAGTASLVECESGAPGSVPGGIIGDGEFGADGSGAENLWSPTSGLRGWAGATTGNDLGEAPGDTRRPTLEMNGIDVFAFTLRVVGKHVLRFLERRELTIADIDLFVFHQANRFMIEHLRRRLKIDEAHFAVHIAEVGNTMSSTIPLALEQAVGDGRAGPGRRVLLVGFGLGYSWGSVLLDYPA